MNGIKQRWHSTPRWARIIGMVFLGLVAAVFFGFFFGYFVMLLWNWLMPSLFAGMKEIGYWQALGILVLSKLLFGGIRGRGYHGRWHHHRWANMTPEEREKFKAGMHGCCGGKHGAEETEGKE